MPPYVGPKGWIGIYLDGRRLDWGEVEHLIEQSYQLVAPRRPAALAARRDPIARLTGARGPARKR